MCEGASIGETLEVVLLLLCYSQEYGGAIGRASARCDGV